MLKITKEDIEIMSTKLFQALISNAFRVEYGEKWFENELMPHIISASQGVPGETTKKYSDFISYKGTRASVLDMDITLCSAILLYDDKYKEKIYPDSSKKSMLNDLRNDRNRLFGHSGVLSDSKRITLFSRVIADLQMAVDTFDVSSFDSQLAKDIQKLQESLFEIKIVGTSNDPLAMQYDEGEKRLSEGNNDDAFQIHNELAEMGFAPSMSRLAELYIKGLGTLQSLESAEKWLDEAIKHGYQEAMAIIEKIKEFKKLQEETEQGSSIAMLKLGSWYEAGELISKDRARALEYYKLALSKGSFFAKNRIKAMAEEGNFQALEYIYPLLKDSLNFEEKKKITSSVITLSENPDEWQRFAELISDDSELMHKLCLELYDNKSSELNAKKCLALAQWGTELKYDKSINMLGFLYYYGTGVENNQERALDLFEEAASLGNPAACSNIANAYMNGNGRPVNLKKACEYYQFAADNGNARAQFTVGGFYINGLKSKTSSQVIVSRDYNRAFEYYSAAAKQEFKPAFLCLADCYNFEYGTNRNTTLALEWYSKADCGEACYKMSGIYEESNDFKKAFEFCQKALSFGDDPDYDHRLGMYFYEGKGTHKNDELAVKHLLKFYWGDKRHEEKGEVAYLLGMLYKNGEGIERNDNEAFKYFTFAAGSDNVRALYEVSKYARRDSKRFDFKHGTYYDLDGLYCFGRYHKTGEEMLKTCRDNGLAEAQWEQYIQRYYMDNPNGSHFDDLLRSIADQNYLPAMEEMLKLYNNGCINIPENKLIDLYIKVRRQGGRIYLDNSIVARLEALL